VYFQQFYLTCLSQASYLIASGGIGAVIDPQRDVDLYLDEAAREGFRIEHVVLTHIHADFVSGHNELAARCGARIYVGAKADAGFWHVPAGDGDELRFGNARLTFLETPGHTVESICVLLTDLERSPEPFAVFTGDTLFVGDVGRPDLSATFTPQELAAQLYASVHEKLLALPDAVEVYPAHGAGSACGRAMRQERSSTIGLERASNPALRAASRQEFVQLLTAQLPEKPAYFARDAAINLSGPKPLAELGPLPALSPAQLLERQRAGATVLDTREAERFGLAHIPGAVNIGLDGQYASWAGTVIGLDTEIVLVAEDAERLEESRMRLARVGIERVSGGLAEGMAAWERAGLPLQHLPYLSPEQLERGIAENDRLQVLDVRRPLEWEAGHIDGAHFAPLNRLFSMLDDIDPERPVAVYCKSGYRSSIAASLLQRAGFTEVDNVAGGYDAWLERTRPTTTLTS
jgi:glyoxylase-like metal-dependent hydrolase (beta-lactamase superfamily II)/rhodanese-related sulfurtransferase